MEIHEEVDLQSLGPHALAAKSRREEALITEMLNKEQKLAEIERKLRHAGENREKLLLEKVEALQRCHAEAVAEKRIAARNEILQEIQNHMLVLETEINDAQERCRDVLDSKAELAMSMSHSESVKENLGRELELEMEENVAIQKHLEEQLDHARKNHEALLAGKQLKAMFMSHVDHPERRFPDCAEETLGN